MELLEYIKPMSSEQLEDFALSVGTTVPHLRNVAYKTRVASAALAAQIQVKSGGKVQVSTLRPKDWHLVWGRGVNQTMNWAGIVADDDAQRGVLVTMAGLANVGGDAHTQTVGASAASVHHNGAGEL